MDKGKYIGRGSVSAWGRGETWSRGKPTEILSRTQRSEVAEGDSNNSAQALCDLLRPTIVAIFVATTLSPMPITNYALVTPPHLPPYPSN